MASIIKAIIPGSRAEKVAVFPGDTLISVNGNKILDLLDYRYYSYDAVLRLVFKTPNGKLRLLRVKKREGEDLGLEFEDFLLDRERSCSNKCIFCFIDQLPRGMRKTLYYKDDDTRLSFLQGNYVTLTNMDEREIERVIKLRVSPINVSVHTMNPGLRSLVLGSPNGGKGVETIKKLARSGITMHCQLVVCPGVNDGAELLLSMRELYKLHPGVASVSVVPVGLTKHREGLYELKPFDKKSAAEALDMVEGFADECKRALGTRLFFCADELYIKAGRELPPDEHYEDYPQLENGVGMLRLFITEFEAALRQAGERKISVSPFTIATGTAAKPFIEALVWSASEIYGIMTAAQSLYQDSEPFFSSALRTTEKHGIIGNVVGIRNEFFGESVDVAGLVTGGDIIKTLEGQAIGERLLIPRNMLRNGEARGGGVFLDDVTVDELSERFGVPIRVVEQDGFDLFEAITGN